MTLEHQTIPYQVQRGVTTTLSVQFFEDGVEADPGTVTVGIVDEAGAEIVAAGPSTDGSGTDPRTYELDPQDDLNLLIVTWSTDASGEFNSRVEVVGEHLFTMREARTFDAALLKSTTEYPPAALEEARARITDDFYDAMGVSHIPRYRRITLSGTGSKQLFLPDLYLLDVRSVESRLHGETEWEAFDQTAMDALITTESGIVKRTNADWRSDTEYRVVYEHGYGAPPLPVKRAALVLLTSYLGATRSSWDPRATSMRTAEGGVISLSTPGRAGATYGLPEVDAVIQRYSEHVPGIA